MYSRSILLYTTTQQIHRFSLLGVVAVHRFVTNLMSCNLNGYSGSNRKYYLKVHESVTTWIKWNNQSLERIVDTDREMYSRLKDDIVCVGWGNESGNSTVESTRQRYNADEVDRSEASSHDPRSRRGSRSDHRSNTSSWLRSSFAVSHSWTWCELQHAFHSQH